MLSVYESLQLTQSKSVRMVRYFMQTETKKSRVAVLISNKQKT